MSGLVSHLAGIAAEGSVADHYQRKGLPIAANRWRGTGGEIDLVARDGEGFVFVEVKKAKDFARAAARLTRRQIERIWATAMEFLASHGFSLNIPMRLDVALVNGSGRIEVIENVCLD
jgi:putative endonuclease